MHQAISDIIVRTNKKGLYDITRSCVDWAESQSCSTGLLTLFVAHTSASLLIQENADPDVLVDMERFFSKLVPENDPAYRHTAEGPDDMPAHIRSALTQTQISIPLKEGKLVLGIWQGIYLFEHRSAPHMRKICTHLIGA
ncbi:MAG: hypothetical protein COV66_08545 [Nitrospinae bacterium CG11_big_fil_rev_8_21_14_0_20_45_15]|nr:MAG: hypothetical protein COV66_08545 [Nitrospinae bacterium CG11_big_fil_rev_8_21_14_0_20_45_15]